MKLYERLPTHIEVNGKRYKLRAEFDRVLEAFDVLRGTLPERDKIDMCVWLLIKGNPRDKLAALNAALSVLCPKPKRKTTEQAAMDYGQDAGLIAAAFRQVYGINLRNEKLHWSEFVELLQGLPEKTKLGEVIQIRTKEIPAPNKHNAKEIEALLQAKAFYALEYTDAERQQNIQRGLQSFAKIMMSHGKN